MLSQALAAPNCDLAANDGSPNRRLWTLCQVAHLSPSHADRLNENWIDSFYFDV
jgi:hypothetical protein